MYIEFSARHGHCKYIYQKAVCPRALGFEKPLLRTTKQGQREFHRLRAALHAVLGVWFIV